MSYEPITTSPSTTIASADHNTNHNAIAALINGMRPQILVPITGVLSTGSNLTAELPISTPLTLTFVEIILRVKTAPTGAALIVDINKNGTTIFSTRPQIDAGSVTGGSGAVFSSTTLADDDVLTFDIDQVGSTVAGSTLTINTIFKY